MEVVVTRTTGAISRAKLQSNHHHHQQTNIQFLLQAGCPSCRPTNNVKALKGKISHSMDLLTPSSPADLPTLSPTTRIICRFSIFVLPYIQSWQFYCLCFISVQMCTLINMPRDSVNGAVILVFEEPCNHYSICSKSLFMLHKNCHWWSFCSF